MSLAFALMAAFNGSTGSCATLSHGLELRHQASPASARRHKDFHPSWATAQAVPDAVAQTIGVSEFLCDRYKVAILDRIISVADEPPRAAGRLSGGRRKRLLLNSYNGLGLCDILATKRS